MKDPPSVNNSVIRINVTVTKSGNYTLALCYKFQAKGNRGKWTTNVNFRATDWISMDSCLMLLNQPFSLPEGMNITLYRISCEPLSHTDELITNTVFLLSCPQCTSETKQFCLSECGGLTAIQCLKNTSDIIYVSLYNGTHCCPCLYEWTHKLCNDCSNGDNTFVQRRLTLFLPRSKWFGVAEMCMPVNKTCISCHHNWVHCGCRDGCYKSFLLSCLYQHETVKGMNTHIANTTNTEGTGFTFVSDFGFNFGEDAGWDLRDDSTSTTSKIMSTSYFALLTSKSILLPSESPKSIQWPLTRTAVFQSSKLMSVTKQLVLTSSDVIYWQFFGKSKSSPVSAVPAPSRLLTSDTQGHMSVSVGKYTKRPVIPSIPATTATPFPKPSKEWPQVFSTQKHIVASKSIQPSNGMTPVPAAQTNSSDPVKRILMGVIIATVLIGFLVTSVFFVWFCLYQQSEDQNEEIGLTKQLHSHLLNNEEEASIQMDSE